MTTSKAGSTFTLLVIFLFTFYQSSALAKNINGFDLNHLIIDQSEVFSGGPGRDGIPSIDHPKFIAPAEVNFLHDDDMVISFTQGDVTKAYPIRILIWHEIANDTINGKPITVTYCPLCGSGMVFDRVIDGKTKSFGVSGLLYRSDVLMYDRESMSLWSQLGMKGVSKEAIGKKLDWLPSEHLIWSAWRQKYPNGSVLSTDTGYNRQYASQAYERYFASKNVMFPVPKFRDELEDKSKVIGIIIDGIAKAYPLKLLKQKLVINDIVAKKDIHIIYDTKTKLVTITDKTNTVIPSVEAYWFAWQGFYPTTLITLK